jgi:ligand-binding sensor domain-containing protein/two-component sensor histidine kinase
MMGPMSSKIVILRHLAVRLLVGLWSLTGSALAERLPIQTYTIADGLMMDRITAIRKDSRHLIWFGTGEGLSWFDGHRFTSYSTEDGLPNRYIYDILQTRSGAIWIGTGDGLCLFRHSPADLVANDGRPSFEVFRHPSAQDSRFEVYRILEDADGDLWCGTDWGLYKFHYEGGKGRFRQVLIGLHQGPGIISTISDLALDGRGGLWIATLQGLYHRRADGVASRIGPDERIVDPCLNCVAITPDGRVWAGGHNGLYYQSVADGPDHPVTLRHLTKKDGLPIDRVNALLIASDGQVWAGTHNGIAVVTPRVDGGVEIQCYSTADGLAEEEIYCLAQDGEENIWVGTGRGAQKISHHGFVSFTDSDGLVPGRINSLFMDRQGRVGVQVQNRVTSYALFDGKRFVPIILPGTEFAGWTGPQSILQDHQGVWWLATDGKGLWRYPRADSFAELNGRKPARIYTRRDGLPGDQVHSIFEDSEGNIWIAAQHGPPHLGRWIRRENRFESWDEPGLPVSFRQDRAGNVWIGMMGGGVWRYRRGRLTAISTADGFPAGYVMQIYSDAHGRLWISTTQSGVLLVSDPDAEHPAFQTISMRDGLCSNHTRFVIEDSNGVFFIGTSRGLDRWDPRNKGFKHFTSSDGLLGNLQNVVLQDQQGNLWFGTWHGLSRLPAGKAFLRYPPEIIIRNLHLGGIPWPIDQLGQREVDDVLAPLERNRVAIEFAGLSLATGDVLSYRYRLGGRDKAWRPLSNRQNLDFVDMRPGDYRIEVEAVNSDGMASPRPAVVSLTILTPIWQRWWFIALVALALGIVVSTGVWLMVRRRLEMERIRTRIAIDLHDDIGSSLTQMSILSEVAVRKLTDEPQTAVAFIQQVSATSRTLVDAMSDIVWAINPARDRFSDLVHRMRRFANDLCADGSIRLQFHVPPAGRDVPLGDDVRRHVYLVFKECLHNVIRHSGAEEVVAEIRTRSGWLELEIRDNGVGFDPHAAADHGHGLQSMEQRAAVVRGRLTIDSRPGGGTRIQLCVPVTSARRGCRHHTE